MHPRFDPAASLRVWAVEVTVAGRLLRVPLLPAADWLPALMTGDPMAVLGLVEDFDVAEALVDGGLTVVEIRDALTEIVESATGRSAVATFALAGVAGERWDVIGADLSRVGVRFDQISIGAALDAIYGSVCRALDEKGLAEFNRILQSPSEQSTSVRQPRGAKPLPASALPYVQTRPKTVPRRPEDRLGAETVSPTQLPGSLAGSAPVSTSGSLGLGAGGGSPLAV